MGGRVVTFPRMGVYTPFFKCLLERMNLKVIVPPQISKRTIHLGVKYLDELMCLPSKTTLGNFIEGLERGANTVVMFDSCGDCRFKAYWVLQKWVLKRAGYEFEMYPIRGHHFIRDFKAIDPSISTLCVLRAIREAIKVLRRIEKREFPINLDGDAPKIGIVGEIYTINEPQVNKDIIKKLREMGASVHNSLPLSAFIFRRLYTSGLQKRKDMNIEILKQAEEEAEEYFPKTVGGHGKESVIHTIYYAKADFDGIVHILPFPCMPETTISKILDIVSDDYSIPLIHLIFDEHTGEAGIDTRLEAFVDVLKRRRR